MSTAIPAGVGEVNTPRLEPGATTTPRFDDGAATAPVPGDATAGAGDPTPLAGTGVVACVLVVGAGVGVWAPAVEAGAGAGEPGVETGAAEVGAGAAVDLFSLMVVVIDCGVPTDAVAPATVDFGVSPFSLVFEIDCERE